MINNHVCQQKMASFDVYFDLYLIIETLKEKKLFSET